MLELDFPAAIERAYHEAFSFAWPATDRVLSAIQGVDLAPLARRSPGLAGYDWTGYLRCSVVRIVRALDGLWRAGTRNGRVLDVGSYFGNCALTCRSAGFEVDAVDAYREYAPAFDRCVGLMGDAGVTVCDLADVGAGFERLPAPAYDAVFCLGVIEHIPHTPRLLMESICRVLKPGGILLIDTPNHAYVYNRIKLVRGKTVLVPLEILYHTELPFEGHHREYTIDEIRWLLGELRLLPISIETFAYSVYLQERLSGEQLAIFREMEADPSKQEVIMAVARRCPDDDGPPRST